MLTFAAGSMNATAAVAGERYVTHLSGNVTQLGADLANLGKLVGDVAVLIGAFIAGAITAALCINARMHRGRRPFYALPLLLVVAITFGVAIVGAMDIVGDVALLAGLSFAAGLQNASVATSTGALVRTTHLTGPATDLGVHVVDAAFAYGETRKTALQHALLRGGKILAFCAGAFVGALLGVKVGYLALLVPAVVTLLATAVSYLPYRDRMVELANAQ